MNTELSRKCVVLFASIKTTPDFSHLVLVQYGGVDIRAHHNISRTLRGPMICAANKALWVFSRTIFVPSLQTLGMQARTVSVSPCGSLWV